MTKIIACDFDGTLCDSQYPKCGKPIQPIIDELLYEQKQGAIIILNTMREGKPLDDAVKWCKKYGIKFDAINDNCEFAIKNIFGCNPRKIFASEYWDDRNATLFEIADRKRWR